MKTPDPIFSQLFHLEPSKGDLKRFEIIETAIKCLAKEGFEGGTFEKIAKRLKTRRSHIAYYFEDRDELLRSVVRYIIAQAQQITVELVTQAKTPLEQLQAISNAAFEWADRYPEQARVLVFFHYQCASDLKYKKLHTQIREAGFERIRALVGVLHGGDKASGSRALDLNERARALQATMTGLVFEYVTTDSPARGSFRAIGAKACAELTGKRA